LGERNEKNEFPSNIAVGIMVLLTSEIYLTALYMVDLDPANANVVINRDKPQAQFNEGL
jgi:hypothetical protein